MQVQISGQHFSLGQSLIEYAENRLRDVVGKYFEQAISANVHFVKQSYLYHCDIIVNEGTGRHTIIKSNAECDEIYSSFDQALVKLEKRLRKYKTRIKDHHKVKISEADFDATKYVINPYEEEKEVEPLPAIIAEQPFRVGSYTVSEAIMRMELEDLPALMFKNTNNGRVNVVYYRKDGNISWVDSKD